MKLKVRKAKDFLSHVHLRRDGTFYAPVMESDELSFSGIVLGSGSYGRVERATCRGQSVAVKIGTASVTNEELLDEVGKMRCISHPSILSILGIVVPDPSDEDSRVMMVLELMDSSLHSMFKKKRGFPLVKKLRWLKQAAEGMAWLHGGGFIHRDLKPRNLLYSFEHDLVKLGDFGLTVLLEEINSKINGTPEYMPPESRIERSFGSKGDVWSFGMCICHAVTGEIPFDGETEALEQLLGMGEIPQPELPFEDFFKFPQDVRDLVDACTMIAPEDRPTFEELLKKMLPKAIVSAGMFEPHIANLWYENFGDANVVPWDSLRKAIVETADNFRDSKLSILHRALKDKKTISMEDMDTMSSYFPGNKDKKRFGFADNIVHERDTFAHLDALWGAIEDVEANYMIRVFAKGVEKAFLIRFKKRTDPSRGDLEIVYFEEDRKLRTCTISHEAFGTEYDGFPTLNDAVENWLRHQKPKRFEPIAPGPFAWIAKHNIYQRAKTSAW